MTLSLQSRLLRMLVRHTFKGKRLTLAAERERTAKNAVIVGRIPKGVQVERLVSAGLRAAWIRPSEADSEKVVLYLHGGGYVVGNMDSYQMVCILMAQTLKIQYSCPNIASRQSILFQQPYKMLKRPIAGCSRKAISLIISSSLAIRLAAV